MSGTLLTLLELVPALAKSAMDMSATSDATKRNAQLVEFQHAIIQFNSLLASIQIENAALTSDKRNLEAKITEMNDWKAEKGRYKLATPYSGAMVYALQKSMSNDEPAHYLCTNCYKSGKPSILQLAKDKDQWASFACPICKSAAQTGYRGSPNPKYFEDIEART